CIESDDRDASMIERALQEKTPNIEMNCARTLAEARALLREISCEVALVDHEMSDGTSLDFLDYVRSQSLDLPVVVVARPGDDDVAVAVFKAGASDCLWKDARQHYLGTLSD